MINNDKKEELSDHIQNLQQVKKKGENIILICIFYVYFYFIVIFIF